MYADGCFLCISSHVCCNVVCLCMFGVPVQLLNSTLLFVHHFPGSTGELGSLAVSRHALMVSIMSAVVSMPLQVPCTSLCPLNVSNLLLTPSVASSVPDSMPVPSPSPTAVVSWAFNTADASLWLLHASEVQFARVQRCKIRTLIRVYRSRERTIPARWLSPAN